MKPTLSARRTAEQLGHFCALLTFGVLFSLTLYIEAMGVSLLALVGCFLFSCGAAVASYAGGYLLGAAAVVISQSLLPGRPRPRIQTHAYKAPRTRRPNPPRSGGAPRSPSPVPQRPKSPKPAGTARAKVPEEVS